MGIEVRLFSRFLCRWREGGEGCSVDFGRIDCVGELDKGVFFFWWGGGGGGGLGRVGYVTID